MGMTTEKGEVGGTAYEEWGGVAEEEEAEKGVCPLQEMNHLVREAMARGKHTGLLAHEVAIRLQHGWLVWNPLLGWVGIYR